MYTLYNSSLNHFYTPLVTKTTKPKKVTDKTSLTILYIYHDTFPYFLFISFCFIQFRRERSVFWVHGDSLRFDGFGMATAPPE